jgi:hypothetical protein
VWGGVLRIVLCVWGVWGGGAGGEGGSSLCRVGKCGTAGRRTMQMKRGWVCLNVRGVRVSA